VKAIAVTNHQARIIDERCILCGTCTHVCPQNAKHVHSDKDEVYTMLSSGEKIIASVAPSFISSFGIRDFSLMKIALGKLGFFDSAETSVGANLVVKKYNELLLEKEYKNFITSACPAVNTLIQLYYPKALPYLAPVDSPMLAHTKILKSQNKDAKIVFIGPCIAKKKEAQQSGIIDATLTFEDLAEMLEEEGIIFDDIAKLSIEKPSIEINKAKFFPISSGIIKSFNILPSGYEYVAIDGVQKCMEILENIESLSGMFLELNACDYSCVNGPCSLTKKGSAIKANSDIRNYVNLDLVHTIYSPKLEPSVVDITTIYPRIKTNSMPVSEKRTNEILAMTGKLKPSDELNCGACGYSSCREKAWAVANGYAELEMCLPYMRERAETMAYEILQNSPNGIVVLDSDLKLIEINAKAIKIYGVDGTNYKGRDFVDFENPTDFVLAQLENKNLIRKKIYISKTKTYVEMTIIILKEHNILFGFLTDITEEVSYNEKLSKVRSDTIATTDEVIKKQMRVAQEIASLLGETTAETKVALLKLKKVLSEAEKKGE